MNEVLDGITNEKIESGKCVAERYGGIQKRHALKSVHSGRDITSGKDLADALASNGGIANVSVVLAEKCEANDVDESDENMESSNAVGYVNTKIPDITCISTSK